MNGKSPSGEQRICSGFSDPVAQAVQHRWQAKLTLLF